MVTTVSNEGELTSISPTARIEMIYKESLSSSHSEH